MNTALLLLIVISALLSSFLLKKNCKVVGMFTGSLSAFLITALNALKLYGGENLSLLDKAAMVVFGVCGLLMLLAAVRKIIEQGSETGSGR